MKKIVYVDMDNVLVDFQSGIDKLSPAMIEKYTDRLDEVPGIFSLMEPMSGAIEAYEHISQKYDTYILSTAPWGNPSAWSDKLLWVKKYLDLVAHKRLVLSHHKNLNVGDYIIDDRDRRGVDKFDGEHIYFGTKDFPDWDSVLQYLLKNQGT